MILDKQAKEDLRVLYEDIDSANTSEREFFWSVLECAGCAEEFKEALDDSSKD